MASPDKKAAYRVNVNGAAGDTSHTLHETVQEPTRRVYVSRVAAKDETTAGATCNVFAVGAGGRHLLATLTLTAAATWYGAAVDAWIHAGEVIEWVFTSVVAADHLTGTAMGEQELNA
jgi:hypothetical protein